METKAGFVTIVGLPNAGKSTLMNALIGEQLSVATNKPQTTRKKIVGILSEPDYQIVFLDTPGILKPEYLLQERMLDFVFSSVKDTDILLMIVDITTDKSGSRLLENETVQKILKAEKCPKILVINKIDESDKTVVEALISKAEKTKIFENIIPISAKLKFNLQSVIETIKEKLPEHPKYYPDDQITDENERFFVSEIIRGKIFELLQEEIPYSTEVIIAEFKERKKAKDYISAEIVVEKETQKPIVIGNQGTMIKKIGNYSRQEIEKFLGREVYLELRVKVRNKWRSNKNLLRSFGYESNDE